MQHFPSHLYVVIAFAALSFLQWLFRKAREQQIKNQQRRDAEQRRLEVLRTGREADTTTLSGTTLAPGQAFPRQTSSAAARAAAAAKAAREQQLREMRRKVIEAQRRKAEARTTASQSRPPQPRQTQQSSPGRPQPKDPRKTPAATARPESKPQQGRPGEVIASLPTQAAAPVTTRAASLNTPGYATHTSAAGSDIWVSLTDGTERSLADVRRAFVLAEALLPPLTLRRDNLPSGLAP